MKAPLLIGQFKAIADPFYTCLGLRGIVNSWESGMRDSSRAGGLQHGGT